MWQCYIISELRTVLQISNPIPKELEARDFSRVSVHGLEFGYVQGREAAFLLQNICPVTEKDVVEKYVDDKTGKDVSIPNDLKRKIDAKAKKIMNKYYQGTKIVITDLDYIFENL